LVRAKLFSKAVFLARFELFSKKLDFNLPIGTNQSLVSIFIIPSFRMRFLPKLANISFLV